MLIHFGRDFSICLQNSNLGNESNDAKIALPPPLIRYTDRRTKTPFVRPSDGIMQYSRCSSVQSRFFDCFFDEATTDDGENSVLIALLTRVKSYHGAMQQVRPLP